MSYGMDATSRLRFAPSPTGTLHVGGARTALFNWLLARNCGGKFVLRIEDTDQARSTQESVQVILDGMKWLGLDWDEGPFYQSQRMENYKAVARELVERGKAYPCFCSKTVLDAKREVAVKGNQPFVYDGTCRDLAADEVARRIAAGDEHTIRFRVDTGAATEFEDMVGGARRFENGLLGDFVIRRADGWPIYQLTVVVDDHEMGITHILRGDDHLSNTPRQILIYQAMGWDVPRFGHVPLIQGPDRSRLSKRHGATSIMEFAREGILPEAMFNYLSLLGWSLDEKTELMTREDLVRDFSIERLNKSAAIFDHQKLKWMNSVYLRQLPIERVAAMARESFLATGIAESALSDPWFTTIVKLEIERSRTLDEMRQNLDYFFSDKIEAYEEKAAKKHFMKDGVPELLAKVEEELGAAAEFEPVALEAALRALAENLGVSFGNLVHPLRLALTGRSASPGIFDVLVGLGRAKSIKRLYEAREWIQANMKSDSTTTAGEKA